MASSDNTKNKNSVRFKGKLIKDIRFTRESISNIEGNDKVLFPKLHDFYTKDLETFRTTTSLEEVGEFLKELRVLWNIDRVESIGRENRLAGKYSTIAEDDNFYTQKNDINK